MTTFLKDTLIARRDRTEHVDRLYDVLKADGFKSRLPHRKN